MAVIREHSPRGIRIFPSRESVLRLLEVILTEINEKWQTGHRYLDMSEYWSWRDDQKKHLKQSPKVQPIR